jgi:cyclopropane-fatty-acyl-phospholipid synthase
VDEKQHAAGGLPRRRDDRRVRADPPDDRRPPRAGRARRARGRDRSQLPPRRSRRGARVHREPQGTRASRPDPLTQYGPRIADRNDLDFTYSLIDRIFRLSLGELADFSGAKYDGDFSLTLEQAQRRKHEYVAEQIGIEPGGRILDLGCGWGPLLAFIRERGAEGVGVTLSAAQEKACRRHGLDVHLRDARQITPEDFGSFDAVASLGAFEHFCSPEEHASGKQEALYRDLFERIADLLPDGGRLYLQTMVYGRNMIDGEEALAALDVLPARGSDAWLLALLAKQFPGSWLPFGREQVIASAAPCFEPIASDSGRLDYIETISQWNARIGRRSLRKSLLKLRLAPRWLMSSDFRLAFTSGVSANKICFERELLDHYRFVFEKR